MIRRLHGIAHGKTIQLDEDSGVADGQEVEVLITVLPSSDRPSIDKSGNGFLRTEGLWQTTISGTASWTKFIRPAKTISDWNRRSWSK